MLLSAASWNCLPQLFNIRPIWSRNAVKANISVHPDKLKVLLPFMAYYMVSIFPIAHPGATRVILVLDVTRRPLERPPQLLSNTFSHIGIILGLLIT